MTGKSSALNGKRILDAFPDRIDLRNWAYQPALIGLPDTLANCAEVPLILDQGNEGACTGFALSAVINLLLARRGIKRVPARACFTRWRVATTNGLGRTTPVPRRAAR